MPRMHPETPDADTPDSERAVFAALRQQLPDEWVVFHGRRLVLPAGAGAPALECELDFLVIDPARGLLVVEVKGGGVARGPRGWVSRDRRGHEHAIEDPGRQASRGARAVDRFLESRGFGEAPGDGRRPSRPRVRFGWGVALPDVDVQHDLGSELPRPLVLDRSDLAHAPGALDRMFSAHGVSGPALAGPDLRALVEVLAPRFRLVPSLAVRLDAEAEALVRLTAAQSAILDALALQPRLAVRGGAGTGKTALALEQASRLAASGRRTLLLCFNRPLADHLQKRARGFDVDTFHGLCHRLAQKAGLPFEIPPPGPAQQRFWEEEAPLRLVDALAALPDERWEAVVVDEGQDFRSSWWPLVEETLREPGAGVLSVFYDPHQDLYDGGPPRALAVHPVLLRQNCRNTARVAAWACAQLDVPAELYPGAPEGEAVQELRCPDDAACVRAVRQLLHQYLVEEKLPAARLVVLSTHGVQKSVLAGHRQLGNFVLAPPEQCSHGHQVPVTSLQRFKGLEADVVILCDVEPGAYTSSPRHLYVGASRARHRLAVVVNEGRARQDGPRPTA